MSCLIVDFSCLLPLSPGHTSNETARCFQFAGVCPRSSQLIRSINHTHSHLMPYHNYLLSTGPPPLSAYPSLDSLSQFCKQIPPISTTPSVLSHPPSHSNNTQSHLKYQTCFSKRFRQCFYQGILHISAQPESESGGAEDRLSLWHGYRIQVRLNRYLTNVLSFSSPAHSAFRSVLLHNLSPHPFIWAWKDAVELGHSIHLKRDETRLHKAIHSKEMHMLLLW